MFRSLTRGMRVGFAVKKKKVADPSQVKMVYEYDPPTAIKLVKAYSVRAFNESIDICMKLGINTKRSEQNIRGSCVLPGGLTRSKKICFFGANAQEEAIAKAAGVDVIGNDEIIEEIKKEKFNFDQIYSTTTAINKLKPLARILGPKGLFPNLKVKTLFPPEEIGDVTRDSNQGRQNGKSGLQE